MEDFGDPISETNYEICIYDETDDVPTLVLQAQAAAGDGWTRLRNRGFHYRGRARASSNGNLTMLTLRAGATGVARITAIGRGARLDLGDMPSGASCPFTRDPLGRCMLAGDSRVTVQLHQIPAMWGGCWEAVYESPPLRSGVNRFLDHYDGRLR